MDSNIITREEYMNILKRKGISTEHLQKLNKLSGRELTRHANQFLPYENQIQILSVYPNWEDYSVYYPKDKNSVIWSGNTDGISPNVPLPKLPTNPYDIIPTNGQTYTEIAAEWGDYIYVNMEYKYSLSQEDNNITPDDLLQVINSLIKYNFFPGLKASDIVMYLPYEGKSYPVGSKYLYVGFSTKSDFIKNLLQGSKRQRTSYYHLLGSSIQNRKIPADYTKEHTSGTEKDFTVTFGYEIGASVKLSAGIPFTVSGETQLSTNLSNQYSWGNKVSNSDTTTQTYHFLPPGKDYKYDDYAYAVYQIKSEYQTIIGPGLNHLLSIFEDQIANNPVFNTTGDPGDMIASIIFDYAKNYDINTEYTENQDMIYATQTPDPTPPSQRQFIKITPLIE